MKLTLVERVYGFDCRPDYTLIVEQEAMPIDYVVMFRYDTSTYGQHPSLHKDNTLKFHIHVSHGLYDHLFDKYGDHDEVLQHILNVRKMWGVQENPVRHRRDTMLFSTIVNLQGGSLASADVVYLKDWPRPNQSPTPTIYIAPADKNNEHSPPILFISCDNYFELFTATHNIATYDILDELIRELKTPTYYEYDFDRA